MKCENCLFMYNEGGYRCKFFNCDLDKDICTKEGCKPKFTELLKLERLGDRSRQNYDEYRERLIKKYDK